MNGKGDDRRPSAISEQELAYRRHQTFGSARHELQGRESAARRIGQRELL